MATVGVKGLNADEWWSVVVGGYQMVDLKKTEDRLRRHVGRFRCFLLFAVVMIVLLCVIIIVMAEKFPAAVPPREQ